MSGIPVVCLLGATGTGKTGLALALAEHFPCTVINVDSRQVYSRIPIVTAQPSAAEQRVCPHRLYGFAELDERMEAGRYARLALKEIRLAHAAGRMPLLVGGTGLYHRAVVCGLAPIPDIPEEVRKRVREEMALAGSRALHARLREVDPVTAERIHPNDTQRIGRALEVHAATGSPLSAWHVSTPERGEVVPLNIGVQLQRSTHRKILAERIEQMLSAGALNEIERARQAFPDETLPGYSGIGCREILAYLRGETDLAMCRERWLHNTAAYAKRQMTWFGGVENMAWFSPEQPDEVAALVASFREEHYSAFSSSD